MDPLAPQFQIALPGIPQVGAIIAEKYRVEAILGVGGMGVVLSARHLTLGQSVAIKILTVGEEHRKDAVERFLREGRAAAGLGSDHVVRIYDVGQLDDATPFMVMERLRGQDLAAVLVDRGPLPVEEAVEYVAQAAMAIAEAHEVGVIHRDLKPSNLFLTQRSDGTACIKVLDFGISKQLSMLESNTLRGDLTHTRQVMGSPAYMSPEQVRDARTVDHRTDIWALGTTLYELLTRHVAFGADTLPAVCAAIAADPPTPIEVHRKDVPEAVVRIVMRCLEKAPGQRFQSARALLTALRAQQGRSDRLFSSRDVEAPPLAKAGDSTSERKDATDLSRSFDESGARSVDRLSVTDEPNQTLLSGQFALKITEPNAGDVSQPVAVSSHRSHRKRIVIAMLAVIGLFVVVTTVMVFRTTPESTVAPSPMATGFNLRIESEPVRATVFEGDRWLGETPLVLPIAKASVASGERRFILRKAGYVDAHLAQGDSLGDRQVQVALTKAVADEPKGPEFPREEKQGTGPALVAKRPAETTKTLSSGIRSRTASAPSQGPALSTAVPATDIRSTR